MTLQELKKGFKTELSDSSESAVKSYFNLLLQARLGLNNLDFVMDPERQVAPEKIDQLKNDLEQLKEGRPIQQIMGKATFMGLDLTINEHCLIPRPETEELISETLSRLTFKPQTALDLGTGSGCIALALKNTLPQTRVIALEKSPFALHLAQSNAKDNKLEIEFLESDMLTYQPAQKFDLIISNPPYIRQSEEREMESNVLEHEPHMALFVDDNRPLLFYEAIAKIGQEALSLKGLLAVEINQELAEETEGVFKKAGFKTQSGKDLSGNWRFVWAWR